jgi:hypothetical protein
MKREAPRSAVGSSVPPGSGELPEAIDGRRAMIVQGGGLGGITPRGNELNSQRLPATNYRGSRSPAVIDQGPK